MKPWGKILWHDGGRFTAGPAGQCGGRASRSDGPEDVVRHSGTAPIIHITNGVHCGTWQDKRIKTACEKGEDLWAVHQQAKQELIREIGLRTSNWLDPRCCW